MPLSGHFLLHISVSCSRGVRRSCCEIHIDARTSRARKVNVAARLERHGVIAGHCALVEARAVRIIRGKPAVCRQGDGQLFAIQRLADGEPTAVAVRRDGQMRVTSARIERRNRRCIHHDRVAGLKVFHTIFSIERVIV